MTMSEIMGEAFGDMWPLTHNVATPFARPQRHYATGTVPKSEPLDHRDDGRPLAATREIKSYEEFAAMMDAATLNEDLRSLFLRRESESCDERDKPVNYGQLWAAIHPPHFDAQGPCDDRDDGFNKTSSEETLPVRILATRSGSGYFYTRVMMRYLSEAHMDPDFFGITYKVGDTTTFSAGPYDSSLGIPVTVHFRKD